MSKIFVAFVGLAVSLPACADWVSYQRTPDTDELYDPAFVSREGKRVKLWTLTDYAKPITSLEGQELSSEKALDRKSTRLNSSHVSESRMPSSA